MATEIDNLVLEHLRALRAEMGHLRDDMGDIKQGLIRVRNDLHELRGDFLRLERQQAESDIRLQRIEKRLNLVDA